MRGPDLAGGGEGSVYALLRYPSMVGEPVLEQAEREKAKTYTATHTHGNILL